jgi:hypothetical protein
MYNITHRDQFVDIINGEGYKIAAEIGLDRGYNATHLLENTELEKLYCFDRFSTKGSARNREDTVKRMEDTFGDRFVLVEGNSSVMAKDFEDNFFDFIYIDGDHRYRGVKRDLAAFWPKVREGGFFGGHDYCLAKKCGVIRAVDEFTALENVTFSFTEDGANPSFWLIKGELCSCCRQSGFHKMSCTKIK